MTDSYDMIDKGTDIISAEIPHIETLAEAFAATGNIHMYDELMELRASLVTACKLVEDGSSQMVRENFERSQEATANMINAALAMSESKV